jgi:hypothetical protein
MNYKQAVEWANGFSPEKAKELVPQLQHTIKVMLGGGFLASAGANQPADFYIDSRVGRLRYPKRNIIGTVRMLAELAKRAGINPHAIPDTGAIYADWPRD